MARVTPQEAAEKQVRRLTAATEDIRRGVNRVTVAPGIAAAASADRMIAKLIESVQSGEWAARVSGVSLQEWKDAMLNKGVGRIAAGIQAAQPKLVKFYGELLPFIDTVKAEVDQMPNASLEDSIARSSHFQRRMAEFKRSA